MGGEAAVTAGLLRLTRASALLSTLPRVGESRGHVDFAVREPHEGILFEHAANTVVLAVVVGASFLQALGAALRKYYGRDEEEYWKSSGWWWAFAVTMAGGLLALVVMPFVPVVVFVPVTTTVQVSANFVFGIYYFKEVVHLFQVIGLLCACAGAILVNLRDTGSKPWHLPDFWESWMDTEFLCYNAFWIFVLALSRLAVARAFHFAFVAGYTSTLTFICMRSVSSGLGDLSTYVYRTEWWGAVVLGLGVFNLATVHVQQLMLRGQLSLVEALFGASQTLIGCTVAGIFFREESAKDSAVFACAAGLCVFGLLLLAVPAATVRTSMLPQAADTCCTGKPIARPSNDWPTPTMTPQASPRPSPKPIAKAPAHTASAPGRLDAA